MTTVAGSRAVEARSRLHALGVTTVVAGILGAASAIIIIAWPDQVSDQHYRASLVRADSGRSR
jgi:hypothetical protein